MSLFSQRHRETHSPLEQVTSEEAQAHELIKTYASELTALIDGSIASDRSREELFDAIQKTRPLVSQLISVASPYPHLLSPASKASMLARIDEAELSVQPLFQKLSSEHTLIAIVDTETTGVAYHDQPISVGAVLIEVSKNKCEPICEVDSYYGLREPTVPIHPRAQEVHGIDLDHLHGEKFDMKRLCKIVDSADVLIAHNANFDRRMLAHVLPRVEHATWACSMNILKNDWKKLTGGKWSLDAICSALNIERPRIHNAIIDCRSLQSVLFTKSGQSERSKLFMSKVISRIQTNT